MLRSGYGFGAMREGSRDADVAGSGVSPSSTTVSLSESTMFSSRMMSSKDSEECEEFAIDAQGVVNTVRLSALSELRQ